MNADRFRVYVNGHDGTDAHSMQEFDSIEDASCRVMEVRSDTDSPAVAIVVERWRDGDMVEEVTRWDWHERTGWTEFDR